MIKSKRVLIVTIVLATLLSFFPAFAGNLSKKIEVLFNSISLYVNNKQISVDNIVYNGTTYVPLRAVGEMIGMKVSWSQKTNRVNLNSDDTFMLKYTDGIYKITDANPIPLKDGYYCRWNYLMLQFDSELKGVVDNNNVYLVDYMGNRINVNCKVPSEDKCAFIIALSKDLELDCYYSLFIPKQSITMANGDLYNENILIYFKTASNVIKGEIKSDKALFEKQIILKNSKGQEYKKVILSKNQFLFVDIPAGEYKVTIDGITYSDIIIEANKINNVTVTEK